MFKKQIKYTDFNGKDRQEDFYFHMSIPEVTRLEAKFGGVSVEDYAKKLAAEENLSKMVAFMEEIILTSYGRKSEDGKSFIKTPAVREEFEYSQAYAELFEELVLNPEMATKFAKGVSTQTKNLNKASNSAIDRLKNQE